MPCKRADITSTSENGGNAVDDSMTPSNLSKQLPDLDTAEGRREIVHRGQSGDEAVRWRVEELFDRDRSIGGKLTAHYGDSYAHARREMARTAAGKNILVETALQLSIDALRDELAGPSPTPLELILCQRIALCWFDANEMDRRFSDQGGISVKMADYRESRRDRANKRFLAACKALAAVRKLAIPAVQINLARQQVNQVHVGEV